jgi:hypothetical protein
MALNVTFDGYCYLDDGTLSNSNVKYQAYFYKQNAGSSPSKWNNERIVEPTGYWNINLGDGDFLGQEGDINDGDYVTVVFWTPTTADNLDDCNTLTQWGAFRIQLSGQDVYTYDAQVRKNICPDLLWTMTTTADVYETVVANNMSEDDHSWVFDGAASAGTTTMYQTNSLSTTIHTINDVNNSDYDWDDGNWSMNLPGPANGSHFWTDAGDYWVRLIIEDDCGCTVTGTKPIRIYWREPGCGIKCHQANGSNQIVTPDTQVTFEFDGIIHDNNVTEIYWKINDSGAYGTTNTTISGATASGVVSHSNGTGTDWCGDAASAGAFTNPGNHLVEAWVTWWDGFDYHTKYCSETFEQLMFTGPTVDFDQDPDKAAVASGVKFVNTSTSTSRVGYGLPDCEEYEWRWDDNGNYTYYTDKPYGYELEVVPNTEFCKVRLCADWSDGWETHTTCTEKDVIFKVTVTVSGIDCYYGMNVYGTADDGTVGGYHWDVYKYTTFSGTENPTGPTALVWESPIGMDQKYKEVAFTEVGWYKLVGWVYPDPTTAGTEASAYYDIQITEVCQVIDEGVVAICPPAVYGSEHGGLHAKGRGLRPNMRAIPEETPCCREIRTFPFYVDNL